MTISEEHKTGYSLIELRINLQRAIEILDDLDLKNNPLGDKKLRSQLKAIYPALDKETKKYNSMYQSNEEGVCHYYDIMKKNEEFIMSNHLIDKALCCSFLIAHELNPDVIEEAVNNVLLAGRI